MLSTVRAIVLLLALLVPGLVRAAPGPAHAAQRSSTGPVLPPASRPVVVVGMPGLTWDDVGPAAPHLTALARAGGTADLVVRTVHESTCAIDGWLTLGAGARATAPDGPCVPPASPTTVGPPEKPGGRPSRIPATVRRWSDYVSASRAAMTGARLGSLGGALGQRGTCVATVGAGAALTAADGKGVVDHWAGPYSPKTVRTATAKCPVVVVDIGAVRSGADRAAQVKALDARLGQVLDVVGDADVLAAALADDGDTARLRPVVVRAPGFAGHRLRSPSTRQDGIVLLTDVAPTVAALRGIAPDRAWSGEALQAGPAMSAADQRAVNVDLDLLGRRAQPLVVPFFVGWLAVQLFLYAAVRGLWQVHLLDSRTARRAGAVVATVAAAVPAATFLTRLVPWWRAPWPAAAMTLVTVLVAGLVAALAWAGPWRRHPLGPLAVVAAATMLVIVGDVSTGSHLSISSLIGEHPTVGGRFYGLGNASSGVLAASTLLLMAAVLQRGRELGRDRVGTLVAVAVGLVVVGVTAAPQLGADFGGPAALLPAVVYLGMRGFGVRIDTGRTLVLGVLTAGVLLVACLADWLRPVDRRTHLGRFTDSVLSGRGGDVIGRKLIQNWDILTSSVWTMAIPLVVLVLALAVWRPEQFPGRPLAASLRILPVLRIGLLAVVVMLAPAMVLNDSGATVPVPVSLVVVPLTASALLLLPLWHRLGERR